MRKKRMLSFIIKAGADVFAPTVVRRPWKKGKEGGGGREKEGRERGKSSPSSFSNVTTPDLTLRRITIHKGREEKGKKKEKRKKKKGKALSHQLSGGNKRIKEREKKERRV